ncbi:MAG: hypothetical protein IJC09_02140 [Clostridia bacterium]|nr:hypothetical protein [Clostridia bacterium]
MNFNFFTREIKIENPRLWFPLGLGEPFLYRVEIEMYCDEVLCDNHEFTTGIRAFESRRTAGGDVEHGGRILDFR